MAQDNTAIPFPPSFWVPDNFDFPVDQMSPSQSSHTGEGDGSSTLHTDATAGQFRQKYDLPNHFNADSTSTAGHYQAPPQQLYREAYQHCMETSFVPCGSPMEQSQPYDMGYGIDAAVPHAYPSLLNENSAGRWTSPTLPTLGSHYPPNDPEFAHGRPPPTNVSIHRIPRRIQPLVTSMPSASRSIDRSSYAHTLAGYAPPAFAQTQGMSAHRVPPISKYLREGKNKVYLPPPPISSHQLDMEDERRKGKGVARMDLASQSEQRADTQAPAKNFNRSQECEYEEGALVYAPSSSHKALKSQAGADAPPPVKTRRTVSGIKAKRTSPKAPKVWCMECGTGFGRSYDLQRHLQSAKAHNSSPAHKCRYCGLQVSREDSLLVHERIHVREDGGRGARRAAGGMETMVVEG
ncbi:hypothetical protein EW146_g3482 [Bondarzewia mesenterica]|uniref:C2H2-type domain-containing protein n=1 Tax=Bondarzewia mesenterica TaxID=1095465 RepID=A0A4S4LXX8_9AGAM|nr:hypothetical protein EW146_g3482 [Bondarzewia mesenterica]